jgi:hypothetical protein
MTISMSAHIPLPFSKENCTAAIRIAAAVVLMMLSTLPESFCQTSPDLLTARAPVANAHARFGWRVDAHVNWAVVSAPFEAVSGQISAGRAYLYSARQKWRQAQIIEAPDAQSARTFGMSVAITDDMLAIGAPGDNGANLMSGAVYVYTRTNNSWDLSAKVLCPEPVMGARFGSAVALSPHVLVVSAVRATGYAEKSGAVYVFERDTTSWRLAKKLFSETVVPDEAFGTSVQLLDDSTIAISRSLTDPIEGRKELVSVFSRGMDTWSQLDMAVPSGYDLFGAALASNDRYLAVGIPGRTVEGIRSGSVNIYDRATLRLLRTLINPKPLELFYFGGSLFMKGNRLYVGCVQTRGEGRDPMGMVAGYDIPAADFRPAQWYPLEDQESLAHSCPQICATDSIVLVSSPFCDVDGAIDAGEVRFFTLSGIVGMEESSLPLEYALAQNYPNPFNAMTHINFSLKARGHVLLEVFNILGQRVATLLNEEMNEGRYHAVLDAKGYASGVYFYRLRVNDYVALKKMLILK